MSPPQARAGPAPATVNTPTTTTATHARRTSPPPVRLRCLTAGRRSLVPERRVECGAMQIQGAGALVTGGASGLGEATVRTLTEAGATVTIVDRDEAKGKALAAELGG